MLIAIDIGNSRIKIGIMNNSGNIIEKSVINTEKQKANFNPALNLISSNKSNINSCIICSVVPELNNQTKEFIKSAAGIEPVFIQSHASNGLKYIYHNPENIGPDRIANVLGATSISGAPVVVVDFGTATTVSISLNENEFSGGLIAPGVETSFYALNIKSSKLPMTDLENTPDLIGHSTLECIQSGVYNMQSGFVVSILSRLKKEYPDIKTFCSGGFAHHFKQHFDYHESSLVLIGCFEYLKLLDGK